MVGNATLRRWYSAYNDKYYAGKLPPCKTEWVDLTKHRAIGRYHPVVLERFNGNSWKYHRTDHEIHLCPRIKQLVSISQGTLLHEMAHLWVGINHPRAQPHGRIWQKEMLRLATIGAFKNLW